MLILGLYVHLNHVHLSLYKDGHYLSEMQIVLEEKELNLKLPELVLDISKGMIPNCIALQRGPSGFTSLRVALAFVEGLSLGWQSQLYTCTHFELLKKAFNIQNGLVVIDHKGSILPGVQIINGAALKVKPYTLNEAMEQNAFLTSAISGVNLSKFLVDMALASTHEWVSTCFIEPDYGILPTYKEKN
jgi:hypothetical protein